MPVSGGGGGNRMFGWPGVVAAVVIAFIAVIVYVVLF